MSAPRVSRAAPLALLVAAVLASALPATPSAARTGPNRCKVPNVHGLTVAEARPRLLVAGCRLGRLRPKHPSLRATVIAESPEVGTVLPRGSKVTLFLRVK